MSTITDLVKNNIDKFINLKKLVNVSTYNFEKSVKSASEINANIIGSWSSFYDSIYNRNAVAASKAFYFKPVFDESKKYWKILDEIQQTSSFLIQVRSYIAGSNSNFIWINSEDQIVFKNYADYLLPIYDSVIENINMLDKDRRSLNQAKQDYENYKNSLRLFLEDAKITEPMIPSLLVIESRIDSDEEPLKELGIFYFISAPKESSYLKSFTLDEIEATRNELLSTANKLKESVLKYYKNLAIKQILNLQMREYEIELQDFLKNTLYGKNPEIGDAIEPVFPMIKFNWKDCTSFNRCDVSFMPSKKLLGIESIKKFRSLFDNDFVDFKDMFIKSFYTLKNGYYIYTIDYTDPKTNSDVNWWLKFISDVPFIIWTYKDILTKYLDNYIKFYTKQKTSNLEIFILERETIPSLKENLDRQYLIANSMGIDYSSIMFEISSLDSNKDNIINDFSNTQISNEADIPVYQQTNTNSKSKFLIGAGLTILYMVAK